LALQLLMLKMSFLRSSFDWLANKCVSNTYGNAQPNSPAFVLNFPLLMLVTNCCSSASMLTVPLGLPAWTSWATSFLRDTRRSCPVNAIDTASSMLDLPASLLPETNIIGLLVSISAWLTARIFSTVTLLIFIFRPLNSPIYPLELDPCWRPVP